VEEGAGISPHPQTATRSRPSPPYPATQRVPGPSEPGEGALVARDSIIRCGSKSLKGLKGLKSLNFCRAGWGRFFNCTFSVAEGSEVDELDKGDELLRGWVAQT
jgi:hypothetical protein